MWGNSEVDDGDDFYFLTNFFSSLNASLPFAWNAKPFFTSFPTY